MSLKCNVGGEDGIFSKILICPSIWKKQILRYTVGYGMSYDCRVVMIMSVPKPARTVEDGRPANMSGIQSCSHGTMFAMNHYSQSVGWLRVKTTSLIMLHLLVRPIISMLVNLWHKTTICLIIGPIFGWQTRWLYGQVALYEENIYVLMWCRYRSLMSIKNSIVTLMLLESHWPTEHFIF
jgi:hypothetical protein